MDTRLNKYVERLVNEWVKHEKIIIGVDVDSTIRPYHTLDNQEDMIRTIRLLKRCQQEGCYIVIHTASVESRDVETRLFCEENGIRVDTINETPLDIPYGKKGRKPYCNHFLDDRAALPAALDILEAALNQYNWQKMAPKLKPDVH